MMRGEIFFLHAVLENKRIEKSQLKISEKFLEIHQKNVNKRELFHIEERQQKKLNRRRRKYTQKKLKNVSFILSGWFEFSLYFPIPLFSMFMLLLLFGIVYEREGDE